MFRRGRAVARLVGIRATAREALFEPKQISAQANRREVFQSSIKHFTRQVWGRMPLRNAGLLHTRVDV